MAMIPHAIQRDFTHSGHSRPLDTEGPTYILVY